MKIGVIADTHSLPIPQVVIGAFTNVDLIIHAGDICDIETIRFLQKINRVRAVHGNMCDVQLKKKLPIKEYFESEGVRIGITHGHLGSSRDAISNAKEQFINQPVDLLIFGHSHHAFNKRVDGIHLFNPGSPNDVIKAKFLSYGMIELNDGLIHAELIKLP